MDKWIYTMLSWIYMCSHAFPKFFSHLHGFALDFSGSGAWLLGGLSQLVAGCGRSKQWATMYTILRP